MQCNPLSYITTRACPITGFPYCSILQEARMFAVTQIQRHRMAFKIRYQCFHRDGNTLIASTGFP